MTAEVMTAQGPGNTRAGPVLRARSFQLTLNEPEYLEQLLNEFRALKSCDYLAWCLEKAPTTGHEHAHIYAHFESSYKISKRITRYGAHIEVCKGSPKQNIAYLEKNGDFHEEGTRPKQGQILTVKELREAKREDVPPNLIRIKDYEDEREQALDIFMEMLDEIQNDNLKAPKIIYFTGPSGKGKTYGAYKRALEMYPKQEIGKLTINNNFVNVINENAKCFVIEEFRASQMHAADFLQLTDKYGYSVNVKGRFKTIRPECIIICSIIHPTELYRDEELNVQFTRRITEIIDLNDKPKTINQYEEE